MNKRLVLAVACMFLMMAGCGGPLFGDGSIGSPCVAIQFDVIDFATCDEGLTCDTTQNPLDAICGGAEGQELIDLLVADGVPQDLAETIANKLSRLWDPLCGLLSKIDFLAERVGTCS